MTSTHPRLAITLTGGFLLTGGGGSAKGREVSTLTQPPASIRAGETISFVASAYSAEDYTLQFVLNNGVDDPVTVDGAVDEDDATRFTVGTLAPTAPGRYAWAEIYTDGDGVVIYGPQGYIDVLPSLLSKVAPTYAASMVKKLRTVMERFASTDKSTVSFGGQSFTRANLSEYQDLLTMYEAKLKAEQDAAASASGTSRGGFIRVGFASPQQRFPDCPC